MAAISACMCMNLWRKLQGAKKNRETDGVADNGKLGSQSAFVNRNRIINDSYWV